MLKAPALAMVLWVVCAPAFAADNAFVGTWKTNPGKSHETGLTVTYVKREGGYHFAGATGQAYDFSTDGKDYPAEAGEKIAWTSTGESRWETTTKLNDKVVITSKVEISTDGKTMTETYSTVMPDGTHSPGRVVRTRLSGGPGLLGTWKTKEATVDADVMTISEPAAGRLRQETPSRMEIIEGPTDGTPFLMSGPEVPKDWYATLMLKNATTLEWTAGFRDKPRVQGVNTVSSDGKTLTSVYWFVGKEGKKFTEVADRQ